MTSGVGRKRPLRTLLCVCGIALTAVACQRDGVKVAGLTFDGNEVFSDGDLKEVLVTQASGWLPWADAHYFDQEVFDVDLGRVRAFYADRGYPDGRVADVDLAFSDDGSEVDIRLEIQEGEPVVLERVTFTGITTFNPTVVNELTSIPLAEGEPLDRLELAASHEHVLGVLRDSGYPHPTVGVQEEDGSAPNRVVVTLSVQPGEAANFGDITLNGVLSVSESAVLRTLAFRPGDLYRESRVLESQRRLNALGLFQFAHVAERPDSEENGHPDGRIPMQVTVAEADPTRLQFGIGYGSEDGGRGSFEWRHRNFLGDARQFTTRGQYSGRLRGMDINLVEPYLFTRALSLGVHGSGWWRDEPAYTSRAFGGGSTVTYRWRQSRGLQVTPIEHAIQVGYNNESLRYALSAETLEDLTQFDELIALGFDPITGQGSGRLAALTVDFDRSAVDATLDPSAGTVLAFHWEHAAPWLGGTFAFDELSGEGRLYVPIGSSVWAGRGRIGVIFADDPQDVPFSGRYFLGGSSSLRGWGRFQVAPLTPDGLPVGGQALVELSTELRMPVAGNFGLVAFLDAGDVWRTRSDIDASALRVSVGPGLRYVSPVGVVRADLGYQLTPIAGLIVSGEPEPRRWRVHFSIGHAF